MSHSGGSSIPPRKSSFPKGNRASHLDESIDLSSPQTWGDFEVRQILGQGAMGTVYKGRQISLDRTVALKVLPSSLASDESFLKRFELESKAVAKISSPHVVQVYAAGNHEGQEYFAMEYVEGMDLAAKLENGYNPSFNEALDIVQQVARGLAAAVELNIIHRDIKPSNIMITEKGLAKIMDFGLVKFQGSDSASMTMAGTLLGTVSYLSPEQGRGEECDKRSDIYSLGVVLYQLLTGQLPFVGDNPGSVIYQHNFVEPTPPREITPDIPKYHQAIVLKAMQKKPDDRYQDPREIIADIDLIKKWKPPKTEETSVKQSVLLADKSLTKSSEFLSDQAKKGVAQENSVLQELPRQKPQKTLSHFIIAGIIVLSVIVIGSLYKLNSTKHGLVSIREAEQLIKDGKYLQSRNIIDSNLAITPDDGSWNKLKRELNTSEGDSLLNIAHSQFERGKFAPSRESAIRVLEVLPKNAKAKKLMSRLDERERSLEKARGLLNDGDYSHCRNIVKKNVDAAPQDLEWITLYTQLNDEEGNLLLRKVKSEFYIREAETIRQDLIKVLELVPDNKEAGGLLDKLNKRDHALKLARKLLSENEYSQCRDVINYNISADPNDPVWIKLQSEINSREGLNLLNKTKFEFERNNYESARDYIAQALKLLPENEEVKEFYSALMERDRDFSLAERFLKAGNFQQCRDIVDRHLSISPKDHDWLALRISLNSQEGQNLLLAIRRDMDNYDYGGAKKKLERTLELLPDNPEVSSITEKLKKRSAALKKGRQLLDEKEFSQCRQLLERELVSSPEDPEWLLLWNDLNQQEGQHQLLLAKFAYEQEKYKVARNIANEILVLLPDNDEAKAMIDQLDQLESLTQRSIEDAANSESPSSVITKKEDLTRSDKSSPILINEEQQDPASYHHSGGSGIQTYPFNNQQNITGRLNLLRRMLTDENQNIDNLEEAVEDFIADVGEDHKEVPELRRRLEDRREEQNIIKTLESLDKAVMNENQDQLVAIVKVKEHVEALTSLMGQPGLVFRHYVHSFERNGDKAIIKVILNHALLYMPATDIYYRYEAQRKGFRWVITSVQMMDRLE